MLCKIGRSRIQHVDQEVCNNGFFQSCLEGLYEPVGKSSHESHGICQQNLLAALQCQLSRRWVKRRKELVLREDACPSEGIEQTGFPCIGVTHYGGRGERNA